MYIQEFSLFLKFCLYVYRYFYTTSSYEIFQIYQPLDERGLPKQYSQFTLI